MRVRVRVRKARVRDTGGLVSALTANTASLRTEALDGPASGVRGFKGGGGFRLERVERFGPFRARQWPSLGVIVRGRLVRVRVKVRVRVRVRVRARAIGLGLG